MLTNAALLKTIVFLVAVGSSKTGVLL